MAFFDNIHFPFFTLQELNLDWLLKEVKRIAGFMPQDGNVGDILTRKSDGAAWEVPSAVTLDIASLPEDTQILDNDQLIFYDLSSQANRKIKPPNLMDSMCSNGTPLMNGTGAAGTSKKPARYDHVHPTDTSRAPANYFQNGALKVANGGTGADNAADAIDNLAYPNGTSWFNGDCNDLTRTGVYFLGTPSNNAPFNWGSMIVLAKGTSAVTQLAVHGTDDRMYIRYWDGATWNAWCEFVGGDSGAQQLVAGCDYQKVGKAVTVWFTGSADITTNADGTWLTLGQLPIGYRPAVRTYSVLGAGAYNSQYHVTVGIYENGNVQVASSDGAVSNLAGCVTFFVA